MLSDLAFELVTAGVKVEIVTSRLRYDDTNATLTPFEVINGVCVHRIWTSSFGRNNLAGRAIDYLTFYLSAGWKLWRCLDSKSIVVAKTDPPLISLVAAPIARMRGAVLVNWLQDLFPEVARALEIKGISGPIYDVLMWIRNLSLRAAHANVVLGSRMEALVQSQGVSTNRVRIIPNWADGSAITPVSRDENSLRVDWGLQGKFVIGYSGNLGRAHEFSTILDAAELLCEYREIVFLFIGGGAQAETVTQEVAQRKLGNVMFKSYQPREYLSESLSVADMHIVSLNPKLEGLIVPSKFYGIAAVGRPTIFIGDPVGEVANLIEHYDCGLIIGVGDGMNMANKIIDAVNFPDIPQQWGHNARAMFDAKFDKQSAMRNWTELLTHC